MTNGLTDAARKRFSKWMMSAKPVDEKPTWTEKRLAIVFGGHTYLVNNGQVYECAHCGRFDPEWSAQEVLQWFYENYKIKPIEIEVTCSVGA